MLVFSFDFIRRLFLDSVTMLSGFVSTTLLFADTDWYRGEVIGEWNRSDLKRNGHGYKNVFFFIYSIIFVFFLNFISVRNESSFPSHLLWHQIVDGRTERSPSPPSLSWSRRMEEDESRAGVLVKNEFWFSGFSWRTPDRCTGQTARAG